MVRSAASRASAIASGVAVFASAAAGSGKGLSNRPDWNFSAENPAHRLIDKGHGHSAGADELGQLRIALRVGRLDVHART